MRAYKGGYSDTDLKSHAKDTSFPLSPHSHPTPYLTPKPGDRPLQVLEAACDRGDETHPKRIMTRKPGPRSTTSAESCIPVKAPSPYAQTRSYRTCVVHRRSP
ncbi:hypothetical protein BGW80DRAFT_623527 [Lactifluus volemus]|nr:hypothetical protein BGW80DRAFT_623527 [Lactifluus volemus]